MPGTKLSSPEGDAGDNASPPDSATGEQARMIVEQAAWQRELLLAPDLAALVNAVRTAPAAILGGCELEYVLPGEAEPPDVTAAASVAVEIRCRNRSAGLLRLRARSDALPPDAPALLTGIATVVETALENLQRLLDARSVASGDASHEAYFEQLFSAAPEAIVVLDAEDRVVRANQKFVQMFGYSLAEAAGRTINELIVPLDLQPEALSLTRKVAEGTPVAIETIRRRRDGSTFHASILGTPVVVHGNQVAVYGIYRDITAQKAAEEALRRLSTTDELTGLFNRRGFFMLAEQQRKIAVRSGTELLLLYIDIDDFKNVNDEFGHLEGDRVLADLGNLLQTCYRNSDIVARVNDGSGLLARMGGDEFVVLAIDPGADGEHILVSRLRERLAEYNETRGAPYRISLSIGAVRVKPAPDSTIDSLLAAADRLMYRDKRDQPSA